MAVFQPKFVDLVRNFTTTVGTGNFVLGPAVNGFTGFTAALKVGDSFYYSALGVDKPAETEVGRGTLLANGVIARSPISGTKTNFTSGTKSIALIAAAEWFAETQAVTASVSPIGQSLISAASASDARAALILGTASLLDGDPDSTFAADSDSKVPTQKAVKTYVDTHSSSAAGGALLAANNLSDIVSVSAARTNLGVTGGFTAIAANRIALANLGASQVSAYLEETGREGAFVWSSTNNSANVTADPQQGIYVAPASDPTGASGAWVRRPGIDTWLNVKWFGATLDDVTNDGAAILAAISFANSQATSGYGFGKGAPTIFFPSGKCYLGTNTLDLTYSIALRGVSCGGPSGAATVLRWADGATGIRTQTQQTSGATTTGSFTYPGAAQATITNMSLIGGFATTESESHGIHLRAAAVIRNVYIDGFSGDGIYTNANVADPATRGNVSGSVVDNVFVIRCRNGMYNSNADSNSLNISGLVCNSNRRHGYYGYLTLGSAFGPGCLMSTNGVSGITGIPSSMCAFQGGDTVWRRYYLLPFGNGANAPSGTTAATADWAYFGDGTAATGMPVWSGALSFRSGGAMRFEGAFEDNLLGNVYAEPDQPPAMFCGSGGSPQTLILGDNIGTPVNGDGTAYGGHITGDEAGVKITGGLVVGDISSASPKIANATASGFLQGDFYLTRSNSNIYDPTLHLNTTNNQSTINFERDGVLQSNIQLDYGSNIMVYLLVPNWVHRFYAGGSEVAELSQNGIDAKLGGFKVAGTQVISSGGTLQAAAFPALPGDVTTSAGSLATTISANAVTFAKFQQVAASSLIGNPTGALANAQGITLAADHSFSGTTLQLGAFTGDITKSAGSLVTAIGANAVTFSKFVAATAAGVVGASTAGNFSQLGLAGGLGVSGGNLTINGAISSATSVTITGAITSSGGGMGYAAGAGGTVTQTTSKSTAVTLNKLCGQITMNAAALAASTTVSFTLTDSFIGTGDLLILNHVSGGTPGSYALNAQCGAGTATINVRNISAASLSEAIVIAFAVQKAVTA